MCFYKVMVICVVSLGSLLQTKLRACPAFVERSQFLGLVSPRRDLKLLSFNKSSNTFREVPIQIDAKNQQGRLIFFDDNLWKSEMLHPLDRVVFYTDDFGDKLPKGRLPCNSRSVYEVRHSQYPNKYAYLTSCAVTFKGGRNEKLRGVHYLDNKKSILTEVYDYRFKVQNYMLFDSVTLKGKQVALNSQINILGNFKNFFSLNINSSDIESYLDRVHIGPLGINAKVVFFLKFLFFKFRLALSTDVSFYRDSAYIPMTVFLPKDSVDYLNNGSGILYSWSFSNQSLHKTSVFQVPRMDSQKLDVIKSDPYNLSQFAKPFCKNKVCAFRYSNWNSEVPFAMDFVVKDYLVKQGFYPIMVDDFKLLGEQLSWGYDLPKETSIGFYFESSKLKEGRHTWDFWMRLNKKKGVDDICPEPVEISLFSERGSE